MVLVLEHPLDEVVSHARQRAIAMRAGNDWMPYPQALARRIYGVENAVYPDAV